MTSKNELNFAYALAVGLLLVGVLSFTASSAKTPKEPLRMIFTGAAGSVMFTHQAHAADYGLSCTSCHHHPSEPEEGAAMASCGSCHVLPDDGSLPGSCLECHEKDEVGVEDVPGKTDAFHNQCIGCHKENDAGPVECAACHVQ